MSSGGGQSGTQTTTQTAEPWAAQQPYLTYGFQQAQQRYQSGEPNYFPNSTVVPQSPQTQAGLAGIENRAYEGNPIQGLASGQVGNTLAGGYLGMGGIDLSKVANSPGIQDAIRAATDATTRQFNDTVMPGIQGSWAKAGRYGSGLAGNAEQVARRDLGNTLGNISASMISQDYQANANRELQAQIASAQNQQQERNRQLAAAQYAPTLAASDYADLERLLGVGGAYEQNAGAYMSDAMNRYNYDQNQPDQALQNYMGLVRGNYGGQSTTTQPIYSSGGGNNILGGLLGIGGLGLSALGSPSTSILGSLFR